MKYLPIYSGSELDKIAAHLKVKESTLLAAIKRIRPILNQALRSRWWINRIRPSPLSTTNFPSVALLVDSVSLQIYDQANQYWTMILDRGYIGPDLDTPGLRRITPKKGQLTTQDQQRNAELGRIRVPVEQFFGRMQQLWALTRGIYRWSHDNFDLDIDNCILLTNAVQQQDRQALNATDLNFHHKVGLDRKRKVEEKHKKRRASAIRYRENKRRRL